MVSGLQVESTMERNALVATAALALLALTVFVAMPVAGLSVMNGAQTADAAQDQNATNATDEYENVTDAADENASAPGEQLAGIVGVQEAEIEGDLEQRTFGIKIARAASQDAQADVVADQLNTTQERLAELQERKADLDEKRESGEISEGRYRAEVAKVAAESKSVANMANQSESVAGELPADLLEQKGIDVEAIQTLKNDAANMTGQEVSDIARQIAGNNVGEIPEDTPPVEIPDPIGPEPGPDDGADDEDDEDNSTTRTGGQP